MDAKRTTTSGSVRSAALVIADAEGVICFWGEGASALIGHTERDAVGSSLDLIVPPDYRKRHWSGFRAAMASGKARFEGAAANIPVLCADGVVRRWPGRFTLIRDLRHGHRQMLLGHLVTHRNPAVASRPARRCGIGARRSRWSGLQ